MTRPYILLTEHIHDQGLALLAAEADYHVAADRTELLALAPKADGLIGRLQKVDAAVIDLAERCRAIGRHGVGLDSIDVARATSLRIPVVFTPEANMVSVAEYVIGAIFALARRTIATHAAMSRGDYAARHGLLGVEAEGKVLGLVGLGRIGSVVARKAQALGLHVWAYDPALTAERADALGVKACASLEELLAAADFVSLHTPLIPATHKLINATRLAQMKPSAYLINAARGPVVDEPDLVAALQAGRIAGAALDVFDPEPPAAGNPLLALPNVLVTPHVAASTEEAMERMAVTVADGVLAVLRGERPRFFANPEVWEDRRR